MPCSLQQQSLHPYQDVDEDTGKGSWLSALPANGPQPLVLPYTNLTTYLQSSAWHIKGLKCDSLNKSISHQYRGWTGDWKDRLIDCWYSLGALTSDTSR